MTSIDTRGIVQLYLLLKGEIMSYHGADLIFPHLGIVIQTLKNHITVFGIDITFYGLIIGTGFVLALLLAEHLAKSKGQESEIYWDFFIYVVIFGVLGARLYYVLFEWDYYRSHPERILNIREGGLAIYGGIIAVIIALFVFCKVKKKNPLEMLDNIFPGVLLGQAMGRWGNFFNCECFGGYTDTLFAMRIRKELANESMLNEDILDHMIVDGGVEYIQVHPAFLYESVWNLCTLGFVLWYGKKKQKVTGEIFALYMLCYGLGRFLIEGIRTDSLMVAGTGLRVSQCVALGSAIAGLVFMIILRKRKAAVKKED